MAKDVPVRMVVSSVMVVEKGDRMLMKVPNGMGYALLDVEHDGIYINADTPILTLDHIESAIAELKKLRRRRQFEHDQALEEKYKLRLI